MLKSTRAAGSLAVALITASALLSACSGEAADTTATVTGTDDACTLDNDIIVAGKVGFEFTNDGEKVSEFYVLNGDGDVMGEVENVTTGTSRTPHRGPGRR
jgi:iron uptake system component EfeO